MKRLSKKLIIDCAEEIADWKSVACGCPRVRICDVVKKVARETGKDYWDLRDKVRNTLINANWKLI